MRIKLAFKSDFSYQVYLRSDTLRMHAPSPPGSRNWRYIQNLELESRHITKFEINLGGQREKRRERIKERREGEFNLKISPDRPTDRPLLNFTVEITIGSCSTAFSRSFPHPFVWKWKNQWPQWSAGTRKFEVRIRNRGKKSGHVGGQINWIRSWEMRAGLAFLSETTPVY